MTASPEASEKLAADAERIYQQLRTQLETPDIETPDKIGQMVIIEADSGDFEIDGLGTRAAKRLRARRPGGRYFGIRIGYKHAESFGGGLTRRDP
jgi:hypothetical protein